MTVAELIEYLQDYPQDMQVVRSKWSEQCLLEPGDITRIEGCTPRPDGWVQDRRPDSVTKYFLRIG